jgi:transcriptional regulator with XRE-family HTH domain
MEQQLIKIGSYLRHHREQAGLNVTQLAASMGVGESTVFAIEAGRRDTRGTLLLRYAALVGASGDYLVGLFAQEEVAA